jgi:hypothetical protein
MTKTMHSNSVYINDPGRPLGNVVQDLLEAESGPVIIVSPFITMSAFQRISEFIEADASISVLTRWIPSEVAVGISDPRIYPIVVNGYPGRSVSILRSLHTKLYMRGERALIGSANLTHPGFGWAFHSNEELLVEVSSNLDALRQIVHRMQQNATVVDQQIYHHIMDQSSKIHQWSSIMYDIQATHIGDEFTNPNASTTSRVTWCPKTSQPNTLHRYYQGQTSHLLAETMKTAPSDIAYLRVPIGLKKSDFENYISDTLAKEKVITLFDDAIRHDDPIGTFSELMGMSRDAAEASFEIVQNWVFKFLGDRYSYRPLSDGRMRAIKNKKLHY